MFVNRIRRVSAFLLLAPIVAILAADAQAQMGWGLPAQQSYYANPADSWAGNGWVGSSGQCKGWQLGVTGQNTNAGVIVRQVVPNSAAARANIVPGDVIVCVAGDQVGQVGNQLFDLNEEINHHADSGGRVQMLVNFRRTGQLRPVVVQLQDSTNGLVGSLAVQGGRLPADAVVTVRLENVSRPYFAVRNGEYSFRPGNFGVGDIPFQLNYDPAYISNTDTYRVRAFVTSGGQTIYDSVQPPFVLTQGNPASARIVLRPTITQYQSSGIPLATVAYNPVDTHNQAIDSAYQQYLGRVPTSMEMAAWYHTCSLNDRVGQMPLELMATNEYFNRVGGTNDMWMRSVFTQVVGHAPSTTEMQLWMRRFAELRFSRMEVLNQLAMQARG